MASSNITIVKTSNLDYQTTSPWIIWNSQVYDSSYSRTWTFQTQPNTTISASPTQSGWTKAALYLDNASDNNTKLEIVSDLQRNGIVFYSYGTGSLTSNGSTSWQTKAWNTTNYVFQVRDYSSYSVLSATVETNLPIFQTITDALAYIDGTKDITDALNYEAPIIHAYFRCKFPRVPVISYHLTCGGAESSGTFEKYEDSTLVSTQTLNVGSVNLETGKIQVTNGGDSYWRVYATANSIEYNGTIYPASQTPIIEHRNLWTRTTFIFTEVD